MGRRGSLRPARPLLFAAVGGAHLYGFASIDSDVDLRAVHLVAAEEVVGLRTGPQSLQHMGVRDGVELNVVSHARGPGTRV
ncbi:nucleotidyltransferase domain-containing protein [Micromonospora sp. LAH09]|nr:nucleotidyltransferase domain-containing protein [Micromonospora cabrerizensis]MCG5468375.1 nucleotidyltransferase domain-containing protein [Micromonospora cabrerizensis]